MANKNQKIFESHRQDCWYKNSCILIDRCDSCIRFNEMKFLMDSSGIPEARQIPLQLTPIDDDLPAFERLNDIKENVVEFVKAGNNLYITSNNTGNGKTSWALKIMLKYFNEIWSGNGFRVRGIYIHVPTFLSRLKVFDNPLPMEFLDSIRNVDLVIWDDIASTGLSSWEYTQLLSYIDTRVLSKKSNIYTSNVASEVKLNEIVGGRLCSRIYSSSEVIEFVGKDWRGMLNDQ